MTSALHLAVRELIESRGLTITALARAIGLSTATISQWLNHKYRGDVAKTEEAIKKFLDLQKERESRQESQLRDPGFVRTTVAAKVFEVAEICHIDNEIGVVCGDSGLGKTTAARQFANDHSGVVFIEVQPTYTAKVLFQELHRHVAGDGFGNLHTLFEEVLAKLKGSGRLVIIDEAEHLQYRALEMLRRLHDKAGVGIMLIGMPRLLANLRGCKGEYAQLYSRVGIKAVLKPMQARDTESIVHAALPGSNGIWKVFHEKAQGNARVLRKLISRSVRVAEINKSDINDAMINAAMETLMI